MIKSGFFNSKDHHREYDAKSFTSLVTNFLKTPGTARYINTHPERVSGCEYLFSERGSRPILSAINFNGSLIYFKNAYMYDDEDIYINLEQYKDDELKDLNRIPNSCVRVAIVAYADYLNRHAGYDVIFGKISYDGSHYSDPVIENTENIEYLLLATADLRTRVSPRYSFGDVNYYVEDKDRYGYSANLRYDVETYFNIQPYFNQYNVQLVPFRKHQTAALKQFDYDIEEDMNEIEADLDSWIDEKDSEVDTWIESHTPSSLTPEQIWNFNNELAIIKNSYVNKSDVITKRIDIHEEDTDKIPSSSLIFDIYNPEHNIKAVINVTTTSTELFNMPITVTNENGTVVDETEFDSTGNAQVKIVKFGTYTFTVTY